MWTNLEQPVSMFMSAVANLCVLLLKKNIVFLMLICNLFRRDETPTAEQTRAFVDLCETFIRRNPLQAIGTLSYFMH